ncbi:hypothetical protein ACIA49_37290 [Kribbella sp. NPDC051587]|uniref:hypothetical protein n=1 Tax=Kribbella sp. NPDC051587 TaxID=3364119 RepID=UPI0037AC0661
MDQSLYRVVLGGQVDSREFGVVRWSGCGGPYDAKSGGYQDNLVVTAEPMP